MKIETVSARVLRILKVDPLARKDDDYLIREVYLQIMKENDVDCTFMGWETLILNRKEFGLPSFESVRRTRQKAQEKYPELRADAETQMARDELQEEYLEFARS